ncbi:MAG: cyclase family protein [Pseudomonadota bacterium]
MCHTCVTESVKKKMLSRRDMFRSGAAVAAAGTAMAASGTVRALADGHLSGSVTDMTHTLESAFPTYFGAPGFEADQTFNFADNGFNLFNLAVNEHTGTHIDAPLHFSADGEAVDEIPVESLVVPLCVIDVREQAAENPDYRVTPDDVSAWMAEHGPMDEPCCVAMLSGWGEKTATDAFRNADTDGVMHFPGFHIEASQKLREETGAVAMAVDTLSLDHGPSADFATHYDWLPTNRYGIENLANLEQVPASGATLVVGAPKHKGGSGGPARIFALA